MKIANRCYAITGIGYIPPWTVNCGFIVGENTTLILDTGPHTHIARTILGYAKTVNSENKILAINLEPHLDHIGGNSFLFSQGVDILGHYLINRNAEDLEGEIEEYNSCISNLVRRTASEASLIYKGTELKNPTVRIFGEQAIDLGNVKAEILFTPGHTKQNISVYIPDEKVLYCADCIVNGYIPNLEAGTVEDWQVWLQSLIRIDSILPQLIVPGHGEIIYGDQVKSNIKRMSIIIEKAISDGIPPTKKH